MRLEIDVHSSTWLALKERMDKDIAAARIALETKGLSPTDTEYHRGRISALRDLLRLPEPKPEIKPTNPHY